MKAVDAILHPDANPLRHLAWLLLGLALAAAPHATHLPLWIPVVASTVFLWRLFLGWRGLALPPRWLLFTLAGLGLAGIWLSYRTLFGRDAGVSLLVVLLGLKLLEMRSTRDVAVTIYLAYFLALTNFFYSQTIPTAVLMLVTVLMVTGSLVGFSAPMRTLPDNLRTAGTLLLQAAPVMLLLFFLFPRVQGPLWGVQQEAYTGVTGLSDSMSPGTLSQLSSSDSIAFRVKFDGTPPRRGLMYWRGPVFWNYDGRTWRPGLPRLQEASFEGLGQPVDYEVTVEPHNRFWLFALDLPARPARNARVIGDYQMFSNTAVRARLRYEMRSYLSYRATSASEEADLRAALQLPRDLNPRARGLAQEWRRNLGSDEAVLREAIDFIRNGKYLYTLEPPLLQRNMVDEFLFDTKQGFCEHFASSFAFLMRAAGIPARVVTGYQGGDLNPVDGYVVVRQADAHAWTEVWMGERGWIRVDPTAAAAPVRVDAGIAAAVPQDAALPMMMRQQFDWVRSLRNNWEALANQWNQWVLGYTPDRQREMLGRIGISDVEWRNLALWLFWSVAVALGCTALWLLARLQKPDPVQKAWLQFCARLARHGLLRGIAEGPLDFTARASAAFPEHATELREIGDQYAELRYGRSAAAPQVQDFRRRIAAFRL